jgi:predicted permease
MQLWTVDPGFDPHNVINFGITPPTSLPDKSPGAIRAVLRQLHSTVQDVPGVEDVSLQWGANPMQGDTETTFMTEGQQPTARQADLPFALDYVVEPEYLKAMRIPLLRGRFVDQSDNEYSARVAVIDSSFAREYFAGQDPIGKHVSIFDFDQDTTQRTWMPLTVVGVVGHVSQFGLSDDPTRPLHAQLYRPLMQGPNRVMKDIAHGMGVYVRFQAPLNPETIFQTISQTLSSANDQMIVSGNESEEEVVARSIASQRFSLALLSAFAGVALLLASIGIYGVLSYLVGQRTQEIGVRMALGAQRVDVLRMVVEDGARMTFAGTAIGLVAAVGLTRLMAKMLFGVRPLDPLTFGAVSVILCGIALVACYLPACRAAKVDPMVALRYE